MTTTVPLNALAASVDDINVADLERKFLFPEDNALHRHAEYLWGLDMNTIEPKHERSILEIRKSMETLPGTDGSWTLVPTEETLIAMDVLQTHNITASISERKSFLTEFSAAQYEYIFVSLNTEAEFFILQPGQTPRRFSAPYTDFPLVTSSANPFFVAFYSRFIREFHELTALPSETWHQIFSRVRMHWRACRLPDKFLRSSYPASLHTLTDPGSEPEPELHYGHSGSKSGSDETVATPTDDGPSLFPNKEECPSLVPDRKEYVQTWAVHVNEDEDEDEPLALNSPQQTRPAPKPSPPARQSRKPTKYVPFYPRWQTDSERGREICERLVKRQRIQ
ncbi:hypothetical protein C8R47DRAFT_1144673 [Mycena vitilis]|nr:hypothetical protein C8R47DRAFT_1144673 [Mycena vitilis]